MVSPRPMSPDGGGCVVGAADGCANPVQVVHDHLNWLCAGLPQHTITDVQTSERVSLLLKDSFVESFGVRERIFMKQFVETQTFSVYCDTVIR